MKVYIVCVVIIVCVTCALYVRHIHEYVQYKMGAFCGMSAVHRFRCTMYGMHEYNVYVVCFV